MIDLALPQQSGLAQHSNASADWGTPELGRRFAACVLRPSSRTGAIDLDYASSTYWNLHWPDGTRPSAYLDGEKGRDLRVEADRHRAAGSAVACGSGFLNAPGLFGGRMVQEAWSVMEKDHHDGWLGSGVWWGFSLEQFASLQDVCARNPLTVGKDDLITTIVPSRRVRYVLHPEQWIVILKKKQIKRDPKSKEWAAEQRLIEGLVKRADDSPVTPPAPPHASYISILWNKDRSIRRRQMDAARQFIAAQKDQPRSLFQSVAIVGEIKL